MWHGSPYLGCFSPRCHHGWHPHPRRPLHGKISCFFLQMVSKRKHRGSDASECASCLKADVFGRYFGKNGSCLLFTLSTADALPNSIIACSRTLSPGVACRASTHQPQLKAGVLCPAPLFSPHSTSQTTSRKKKKSLWVSPLYFVISAPRFLILLYLAVVFMLTRSLHANKQHGVATESHWGQVGGLLGQRGDVVLDIGSALDREELGSWRSSPEKQQHATDCLHNTCTALGVMANICLHQSKEARPRHHHEFQAAEPEKRFDQSL